MLIDELIGKTHPLKNWKRKVADIDIDKAIMVDTLPAADGKN